MGQGDRTMELRVGAENLAAELEDWGVFLRAPLKFDWLDLYVQIRWYTTERAKRLGH